MYYSVSSGLGAQKGIVIKGRTRHYYRPGPDQLEAKKSPISKPGIHGERHRGTGVLSGLPYLSTGWKEKLVRLFEGGGTT